MSLNENFRRDLVSKAYELSKHTDIDNIQEKLTNPATFNKRFKKIQESVISVVEAMADLASKDKKYLQTFFQGYVNPIYVKSFKYESKNSYLVSSYFSSNGTPIAFNEARVFYSYYDYSNLEFNDSYVYMFRNGKLLEPTEYDVYNTAYGLKGFVKSTAVSDNDEITVVINKKYNPDIKLFNRTVSATNTSFSFLVPLVNNDSIGQFYNIKHVILYIKKSSYLNYIRIPKSKYTVAMDVTGNNLNISISNYSLTAGDIILVGNTTSFWNYTSNITTSTNDCCVHPSIDLKHNNLPVPFESVYDFDVFYDDLKLIPEIHYSIAYSTSPLVPDKLVFNFDVPSNETHKLKIFKNEPAIENDFLFTYKELLNEKGLEEFDPNFKFPIMPKLGYCYINGKFIDNANLSNRHRSLLEVSNISNRQDFTYSTKIVFNQELEEILDDLKNSPSEMDLVVEYMGLNNVISNLYSSLPTIVEIPEDDFLTAKNAELIPNRAFWTMFLSLYNYKLTQNSNFILDANQTSGLPDLEALGITHSTLDANECSCQTINLDANITW